MKKYSISDICKINSRKFINSKFSSIQHLDTGNITRNRINEIKRIEVSKAPSRAQNQLGPNSIVYSMVRPNLEHFGFFEKPDSDLVVSSGFIILEVKQEFIKSIDPKFLYLLITQKSITKHLSRIAENSVSSYPSITSKDLSSLSFFFPSLDEQKNISNLFFSLEKKIELNLAINRNLEAIARQLYDYWFVQFDFPDENGRPYKSSGGTMVWNEKLKKEIPENWEPKMIRNVCEIQKEICSPKDRPDTIFHHYSIPAFDKTGAYVLEKGIEIQSNKLLISNNDILFSKLNPWTSRVVWCGKYTNQIASTEFMVLRPKIDDRGYLYMILKDPELIAYASRGSTGTSNSHKRVNPEFLLSYHIPYETSTVSKFSEFINSIQIQVLKNRDEITLLASQRDELLPLLMNEQVSVKLTKVNCDLSNC